MARKVSNNGSSTKTVRNGRAKVSTPKDAPHEDATLNRQMETWCNEVVANLSSMRGEMLKELLSRRRDVDAECDYPKITTAEGYQALYDKEAIAARAVEAMAKESWQVLPKVYELETTKRTTKLETAWDAIGSQLQQEKSWHKQEEGSSIWEYIKRADILSGVGHYGILLLGFNDITLTNRRQMKDPIEGVTERDRPDWESIKNKVKILQKGRRLTFIRVFSEAQAPIARWDNNPASRRFGRPMEYLVTFNDPTEGEYGGVGLTTGTRNVHWTRCVHIADTHHQAGSSDVFAVPRLKAILHRVLDLRKEYGAGGEGYWQNSFPIVSLETVPQLGGDVAVNTDKLKQMMQNVRDGLQRALYLIGMQAKTLAPNMIDPTPFVNVAIEAICIKLGMPVRIFKGSERGELASSQDDVAWNDRLKDRQNGYITPRVIVPVVDRLINTGVLPEPESGEYRVWWPDLTSRSKMEIAQTGLIETQAMVAYVTAGVDQLVPPVEWATGTLGKTDEEARTMFAGALLASPTPGTDIEGNPEPLPAPEEETPVVPTNPEEGKG